MLADDFIWIRDAGQIRGSVPLKQLGQIEHELLYLFLGETQIQFAGRTSKKLPQLTLMFHVEQLREMQQEVKSSLRGSLSFTKGERLLHEQTLPYVFRAPLKEEKSPLE